MGPAIRKTAGFGYDGKGQYRVRTLAEVEAAWKPGVAKKRSSKLRVDFEDESR